jgi:hypothetical protein
MPDGSGGKQPDPEETDPKGHGDASRSGGYELSPLERLVAAKQAEKQAQRKRDSRVLAVLAAVAVVLVGGGVFALVRVDPSLFHRAAGHRPSARAAPKASVGTARSPLTVTGPPADPFAGSPADSWADGAAGIVIPTAKSHGPYTAAQVRAAYETTRKILIAENLDSATLRGGAPTAFADLLPKQERTLFLTGLSTRALNKDGVEQNTRTWVTSFAPGETRFVTTVIKVRGTMRAGTATDSGSVVLRITFDYLFTYAVEPPGAPADWMRIVQQRYGTVDFSQWDDPGGPLEPWLTVQGGAAGGRCGERDGYIHPQFPSGPPPSVQPSGSPENPYSLATPAIPTYGCHATTGT